MGFCGYRDDIITIDLELNGWLNVRAKEKAKNTYNRDEKSNSHKNHDMKMEFLVLSTIS